MACSIVIADERLDGGFYIVNAGLEKSRALCKKL
jgi:hypothetical protein